VRKAHNLPPSCVVVTKSWSLNFLEPSGPVQACNGTALPILPRWKAYCQLSKSTPDSRSETKAILVDAFVHLFRINRKRYRLSCVVIAQRAQRIYPGIESQWRGDFPRPSRPGLVTTQVSVQWLQIKVTEAWH